MCIGLEYGLVKCLNRGHTNYGQKPTNTKNVGNFNTKARNLVTSDKISLLLSYIMSLLN